MGTKLQKNVSICLLRKFEGFDDIVLPLYFSLKRLGYACKIVYNTFYSNSTNIIFGLHDFPNISISSLPEDCIIYNIEQINIASIGEEFIKKCSLLPVWDYSEENKRRFSMLGVNNVTYVPLGYSPEMTRISPNYPKDIDVLFYGTVNERRMKIIRDLQKAKIKAFVFQDFGLKRDILIARSKLILNIHYYLPGIQEVIRLGYLWANSKCVICECNSDTSVQPDYKDCAFYCPYEEIVEKTCAVLKTPRAIEAMGNAAFLQFKQHEYTEILEAEVGCAPNRTSHTLFLPLPKKANVGSGKSFIPEALNIDINPQWNPDIVLDISSQLQDNTIYKTNRFGDVRLHENMFSYIRLFDVLEHIVDIKTAMTNLLFLLCIGGELHINVPYDLSLAAWQDPTHVHAFNENSWLYYTEWHWYLGWRDYRFDMISCVYTLSDFGNKLKDRGIDLQYILRKPRAVDLMEVRLRKRHTTFEEKMNHDVHSRAVFTKPENDWSSSIYIQ